MALITTPTQLIPDLQHEYHTVTIDSIGQDSANTFTCHLQQPLKNVVQAKLLAARINTTTATKHCYVSIEELDSIFTERASNEPNGQASKSVVRNSFASIVGEGTATFMILGNICTRSCGFCGVKTGRPETVDWDEPEKVARSIKIMNIKHAVITSVDRDDLKDMGSIIWAETVNAIRRINPSTTLETLIPDFQGNRRNIDRIVAVAPEVVSHNVETVSRLTRKVRVQAKYQTSLEVLHYLKEEGINRTKSGIMLGLGEKEEEVLQSLHDLRASAVDVVTIGQYLQPSKKRLPVHSFITPDVFKKYETFALDLGFKHVESGPLVRSSYKAHKHIA